ncbi:MAG TPA: flagellar biosynthesis protein FlhF [Steroidobacteraceae bacterium]|nr:flagellar biosynthesis protein FlhF [Steroidobacteraceae bacterium]
MKIQRFIAPDLRTAMWQVREALGSDAVILSTRQVAEGVELSAAIDHDLADGQHWNEEAVLQYVASNPPAAVAGRATGVAQADPGHEPISHQRPDPEPQTSAPAGSDVSEELKSLRLLLEQQLAALAWNDYTRREPQRAQALHDLTRIGLASDIARLIVDELPATLDAAQVQRLPLALLARSLPSCEDPVAHGGCVALIGAPGSGKTTTLSKLAVRWVLEHAPETLAIISADEARLGSHEQLRALGRLLGVPVQIAADPAELAARLDSLAHHELVLVDMPGVAARDQAGMRALGELCAASDALRSVLVLPASAQGGVLEETLEQYQRLAPCCAVLTRVDEAALLGGALSALVRAQLPLALVSEGPNIPEDLRPARSHQLVARAVELSRNANHSADEDLLAHRYGGSRNVAA